MTPTIIFIARKIELFKLTGFKLTGLTGLEPATSAVTGRCSNQLNYSPFFSEPCTILPPLSQFVKG